MELLGPVPVISFCFRWNDIMNLNAFVFGAWSHMPRTLINILWPESVIHLTAVPLWVWMVLGGSWHYSCCILPCRLIEASWCDHRPGVRGGWHMLLSERLKGYPCCAPVLASCAQPAGFPGRVGTGDCHRSYQHHFFSWENVAVLVAALALLWYLCVNPVGVAVPFTCSLSTSFQVH